MKRTLLVLSLVLCLSAAQGAPFLKPQPEPIGDGSVKVKLLAGAKGVPAPTPQAHFYRVTFNGETKNVKWFRPVDLWRNRQFLGEWTDKHGNVQRLARVRSLAPVLDREDGEQDEIEAQLDELEKSFEGKPEELDQWRKLWGGRGTGRFVEVKGQRFYVEFEIAEIIPSQEKELEKLLKGAEKSLATVQRGGGKATSMKWWEETNPKYRFLTNLDKAKGGRFIQDTMKQIDAMRKSYEFYIPPKKDVEVGVVRVFKTLAEYREYRASTGVMDTTSSGLWDPSRAELLVSAEDPKRALSTMRHEAFHQYLHYATGNGHHAMWFNEGHACFFENVEYNASKNSVKVVEKGNRAMWVAKDPVKYANALYGLLRMTREQFYSGDQNLHYCTAWALVYFLEKGAYTSVDFMDYRKVIPKYLELTAAGMPADQATVVAWSEVAHRNLAADFLKFWKEKRKAAINAR